jgi:hypothetical protein
MNYVVCGERTFLQKSPLPTPALHKCDYVPSLSLCSALAQSFSPLSKKPVKEFFIFFFCSSNFDLWVCLIEGHGYE